MDEAKTKKFPRYLTVVVVIAALGGMMFGYDQGVMSGAINFIGATFKMSSGLLGFISGCIPLGAMVGCIVAGWLGDRMGRKILMSVSAVLFAISGLGCAFAPTVSILVISRLVGGLGVGMVSTLVPLYIAEIAPKETRGKMVGGYQLAIAGGIFIVYLINALIANTHSIAWNQHTGWRMMFLAGVVPGVIFFILLFFIPESPRFLINKNQESQAEKIMSKVSYDDAPTIRSEIKSIKDMVIEESKNKGFFSELFRKGTRKALFIGVMCAMFAQLTGVNAIGYYAPMIFTNAGAGTNAAMIETVFIGLVKVTFVVVFMALVDRLGRKRLLQYGGFGMAICLFLIAFCFSQDPITKAFDIFIIVLIITHTIFFELSWGGGAWVLISEMFPNRIRGRAASLCSATLWLATYAVTQMFPIMLAHLGEVWTFSIFGVFCICMGLFIQIFFSETAGKSLEQIQRDHVSNS